MRGEINEVLAQVIATRKVSEKQKWALQEQERDQKALAGHSRRVAKQVKHRLPARAKNPDNVAHINIIVHYRQRGISYEDIHRDNKRYLVGRV